MERANLVFQKNIGLNTISLDQVEELHLATLEVLDRVGVNVSNKAALELLKENGARVDGNRVRIPAWMVQQALSTAPQRVAIGNRDGERAMFLESRNVYYGTGSATQYVIDIETGKRRTAVKQDVANAATVADTLKNVDFIMSMALANDVPAEKAYVHEFEAMVLNSAKPILFCCNDPKYLLSIFDIAETVVGSYEALVENPFCILYGEPNSPLQHSNDTIEKLMVCAEKRMPFLCGPAALLGGTGPVTAAGTIIVENCEILSALVIHQLKCKGAPFIYGTSGCPLDMKTLICSYGGPEEPLNCAAMSELANYYHLPTFSTAGGTDAHVFDQQAGMEIGFNLLFHGLAGINMIHDMGYLGAGDATSLELLLLCEETVGMIKHLLKGIEITPETMALDLIEKVGIGGNYFAEEHTFQNFREHVFQAQLLNRRPYDKWNKAGGTTFEQRANQKVRDILENSPVKTLKKDVIEKVKEITNRA